MAIPALTDGQIESDQPLDEAVMSSGYKARDDYLWSTATNGGTGIAGNIKAFGVAFGAGHSHDGTDGEGANIDTAGIANGAASLEPMFQDNCVSAAKIAANTMTGAKFASRSVTSAKLSGAMGGHFSGSQAYDTLALPDTGAGDVQFLGDRAVSGHPAGVICRPKVGSSGVMDFLVVRPGVVGFNFIPGTHAVASPPNWEWDFYVV